VPTIGRPRKKRPKAQARPHETEERVRFALLLLARMAAPRTCIEALMKPRSSDPTKPGGLGLTRAQAEHALALAQRRRREEFAEVHAEAVKDQSARLVDGIAGTWAAGKHATALGYERLFAQLHGTLAPKRIRVEAGPEADIARALAGMTAEELAALDAEDDG